MKYFCYVLSVSMCDVFWVQWSFVIFFSFLINTRKKIKLFRFAKFFFTLFCYVCCSGSSSFKFVCDHVCILECHRSKTTHVCQNICNPPREMDPAMKKEEHWQQLLMSWSWTTDVNIKSCPLSTRVICYKTVPYYGT